MSEELPYTEYCLGTMDPRCDRCQKQANWDNMQELPNQIRLGFQNNMTRIDTVCIDVGYPHFEEKKDGATQG